MPKALDQPDHGNGVPDNGSFRGSRGLGQDTIWQSQGEHLLHERLLEPISGLGGAAELCTVHEKQQALCHPHTAPFIAHILKISTVGCSWWGRLIGSMSKPECGRMGSLSLESAPITAPYPS